MADNYLEKKFEEHLNAPYKSVKTRHAPIKERRAAVLRGADGIGPAVVRALRVAGHKVALCDVDEQGGREVALRTGSAYYHIDPTNSQELADFLRGLSDKWGGVDIIVYVVPKPGADSLLDAERQDILSYSESLLSPLITSAQFMAHAHCLDMTPDELSSKTQYGRIVAICPALTNGGRRTANLALANSVVVSLAEALAANLLKYHVTVNSITPLAPCNGDEDYDSPQMASRKTTVQDNVAKTVRFIIDESSDFLNAQNIVVGG